MSELGLLLLDESKKPLANFSFPKEERAKNFLNASSGILSESEITWLKENMKPGDVVIAESQSIQGLGNASAETQLMGDPEQREIKRNQISLIVDSGLASTKEEAEEVIRDVSVQISSLRIKEMSSNPDLQAMEAVQALDEIDKTANIVSSRLREWYGLHFPELTSIVDDNISLTKLILNFKSRSNYEADLLEQMGYSKAKSKAIETAAKSSRGADMRDEDLARIVQLAEEAQHLFSLRDKLASHVEKTMREVAPESDGNRRRNHRCAAYRKSRRSAQTFHNARKHDPNSGSGEGALSCPKERRETSKTRNPLPACFGSQCAQMAARKSGAVCRGKTGYCCEN